ncbi:MAG: ligase-associated DNA damage response DEXH box helicase [Alphaproteobacteria bacterium]
MGTLLSRAPDISGEIIALPKGFGQWFDSRGWQLRDHQAQMIAKAEAGKSALLVAPTGGGKTLAGFLPSLIELSAKLEAFGNKSAGRPHKLHTLYVSPLKALAVDVARNLLTPVEEMGLDLRIETRTGDTPPARRQRQRRLPPDILLATPEQLTLLTANRDADRFFGSLKTVVVDELHAIENTKRGDLLALDLQRLRNFAPDVRMVGLSATVAEPERLQRWLLPQPPDSSALADLVTGGGAPKPIINLMDGQDRVPWAGHTTVYAVPDILKAIKGATVSLIFVNTRSQAERIFQELWHANKDNLPIALHHGSLSAEQRRKVEAAMIRGDLKAVVCTSTLDLGIDWGAVDLVIQLGAPKGAARIMQRIGRANHTLEEASEALFVPSNRFEVLECEATRKAVGEGHVDGSVERPGALDVLCQHILGCAVHAPFAPDELYGSIRQAAPYRALSRETFDKAVAFVSTGGYALERYDRYKRLVRMKDGRLRLAHPDIATRYRLNAGTIVEAPMVKVRMVKNATAVGRRRGGRYLGEIEEMFIEHLAPGDTFLFGGHIVKYEGMHETEAVVTKTFDPRPKIPSYMGGKFPLSTFLAERVRHLLGDRQQWQSLPGDVAEWLDIQQWASAVPKPNQMLVETFPHVNQFYMVCYPFEGRLAHQTLGMLLTRRLERMRMRPLGFVASEYALAIWGLRSMDRVNLSELFAEDMLGDDLESWLGEAMLMKRTFRACATIAGLIEKNHPGKEKSGRQMTVSSDLIYDVLKEHEPDHILLDAAWADAHGGLLDLGRLADFLARLNALPGGAKSRILTKHLDRVSPLAVPVLLDIGKEPVQGEGFDQLLGDAADSLIEEAVKGYDGR